MIFDTYLVHMGNSRKSLLKHGSSSGLGKVNTPVGDMGDGALKVIIPVYMIDGSAVHNSVGTPSIISTWKYKVE